MPFPRRAALMCLKLAFSLVAALALAELAIRLAPARKPSRLDRPRWFVRAHAGDGVRDPRPIGEKPDGTYRVFVLGDSFTWGTNVAADGTFPHHLEWLLNQVSSQPFEVYNYGVEGSCTADQLKLLDTLSDLQPDLIVLGYFLNDPDPGRNIPPGIAAVAARLENPPVWESALRRRSRLFQTSAFRVWSSRLVEEQIRYFRRLYDPEGEIWKRHRKELVRFVQKVQDLGAEPMVLLWPHLGFPLDHRYPFEDAHALVTKQLEATNASVIDLLTVFQGIDHQRLEAIPALDSHPNEIAHRLASEAIFHLLRRSFPDREQALIESRLRKNAGVPSVRMRLQPLGFR